MTEHEKNQGKNASDAGLSKSELDEFSGPFQVSRTSDGESKWFSARDPASGVSIPASNRSKAIVLVNALNRACSYYAMQSSRSDKTSEINVDDQKMKDFTISELNRLVESLNEICDEKDRNVAGLKKDFEEKLETLETKIDVLTSLLVRAVENVPSAYTKWHNDVNNVLRKPE